MNDPKHAEHADLKERLMEFLRKSGHVAQAGTEAVADGVLTIALSGKLGG
jgi:hypothetical protein